VSRKRQEQFEAPGKDSFLDVVANVVAILIILVIVVGSQASKTAVAAKMAKKQAAAATSEGPQREVAAAEAEARAVEAGVQDLQQRIDRQHFEISYRQAEREQVQLLVTIAEQRLAEHRNQLGDAERSRYDLEAQLVSSRGELAKLSQTEAATGGKPPPVVLQHLPTPMARTVFGTEIHFRLLNHRLTYVPWDEMIDRLKADAKNHLSKLRDAPRVELSLPEVAGFGARYVLRRTEAQVELKSGTARQSGIELEHVYFIDAEPNLGQPVTEAFLPGSQFRTRLAALKPQSTTVTIWVYPDSFDDFRLLKAELFKNGFLTAARPMPMGEPIAGSPSGTRSSAE
jgi:hypothetical protein